MTTAVSTMGRFAGFFPQRGEFAQEASLAVEASLATVRAEACSPEQAAHSALDLASVLFGTERSLFADVALRELHQLTKQVPVHDRLIDLALASDSSVSMNGYDPATVKRLSGLALESNEGNERYLIWRAEQSLASASVDADARSELATFVKLPFVRDRFLDRLEEPGERGLSAAVAFHNSTDARVVEVIQDLLVSRPDLEGPIAACAGTTNRELIEILCSRASDGVHSGKAAAVLSRIEDDAARAITQSVLCREVLDGRSGIDSRIAAAQSLRPVMSRDHDLAKSFAELVEAGKFALLAKGSQLCLAKFGIAQGWDFWRKHSGIVVSHTLRVACAIAILDSDFGMVARDYLQKYANRSVPLEAFGIRDRVRHLQLS